jgi:hypothetical protein
VEYSYRIFDSIERLDLAEWQRIASCDASITMDPRFLAAVEVSMKQAGKFWYIVFYDQNGVPVACTCVSSMTVDLVGFADPVLARIVRFTPLRFSRLRQSKLLIAGLPIGTGQHTLALAQRSASTHILPVLDRIVCDLAAEEQADAILYKEFGEGDLAWMAPLLDLGYQRIPTPPTHLFRSEFEDFSQYSAALRKGYRKQIQRTQRKLRDGGLEIFVLTDPDEILRAYTPEVHAMYLQMAERAAIKLEVLPIEFLHQLAVRLTGQVELLAIRKDGRIVAFGACLYAQSSYNTMYAGLDYRLNHQFDLYFNLVYAALEQGIRRRASTIVFGMGSDAVKARIGCHAEPLYVFVKGRGPLMSFIVRAAGRFLIAPEASVPPFNVFKKEVAEHFGKSGGADTARPTIKIPPRVE